MVGGASARLRAGCSRPPAHPRYSTRAAQVGREAWGPPHGSGRATRLSPLHRTHHPLLGEAATPAGGTCRRQPSRRRTGRRQGSTRILAWASGSARSTKAWGTPSMPTEPVISGSTSTCALGDVAQGVGELVGLVAEHELHVELLDHADHRLDVVGLHAHADDEDLGRGRGVRPWRRRACPGTPTAS